MIIVIVVALVLSLGVFAFFVYSLGEIVQKLENIEKILENKKEM